LGFPELKTAAEPHNLFAAANWMWGSIPDFAKTVASLYSLFKTVQMCMKSAKSSKLTGFKWNSMELPHRKSIYVMCLLPMPLMATGVLCSLKLTQTD
jgi:hypothetical protein